MGLTRDQMLGKSNSAKMAATADLHKAAAPPQPRRHE
jgi:hypothetical protein